MTLLEFITPAMVRFAQHELSGTSIIQHRAFAT